MRKWSELEADFRALRAQSHDDGRLDHQYGAAGEHWRVAGGISRQQIQQFEALAQIAGQKILDNPAAACWPDVVEETDPMLRWYRALRHPFGAYTHQGYGRQTDQAGNDAGAIYLGRIDRLFVTSANLCTELESRATTPQRRVEILCAVPRYSGPCKHWRSARNLLESAEPDYAAAVHEAVSAVEGLCRILFGNSKITLGDGLQRLRQDGRIHPALCRSIEGLWGFSSAEPGIRHGALSAPSVKGNEAHFAIQTAEAALALLLALDSEPT
jgi:hypothetical protein